MVPKNYGWLRLGLALLGLAAVAGGLAFTDPAEAGRVKKPAPPTVKTHPPVRYTVAPGVNSRIVLKTLPGGVSTLHHEGKPGPGRGVRLHAHQDGTVRFHVRPRAESRAVAKLFIECKAGDRVERYPLELRFDPKPTAGMPFPTREGRGLHPTGALVRRALSEKEIGSLSDRELWKRGYPLRPNPREAPKAFATWHRVVSSPATVVTAHTVSGGVVRRAPLASNRAKAPTRLTRPGMLAAPLAAVAETSKVWSGFVLQGSAGGTYDRVEGTWKVPAVTGPNIPLPSSTAQAAVYSSLWVGLVGDAASLPNSNLGSLWQAGTEQQVTTLNLGTTTLSVAQYYAWSQLYPDEGEQRLANFTVEDGDEIHTQVWIGDNQGQPTKTPTHYGFVMENLTQKETTGATFVLGSKKIVGRQAVWILESPLFSDKVGLSNYGTATLSNAHARRASSPAGQGFVSYGNDPNAQLIQYRMTSDGSASGNTLSSVTPVDASTMRFQWAAFR
jgi:hypothetical protein